MRTSAAIASFLVANTGLRSSSTISGKSLTSCDTLMMMSASASRLTGSLPRTPFSMSWAYAVEHRQCVVLGGGSETEGDVLQHLDQHAAEAERHELAERAVGDGADDDLGAAGQHLLDLDAFDLGVGFVFPGIGQNGRTVLFGIG